MSRLPMFLLVLAVAPAFGEEMAFGNVSVDRLEHLFGYDTTLLDMETRYGTDQHKFAAKLSSENVDGDGLHELQLLYIRPVTAYFDLQLGVLAVNVDSDWSSGAVVGLEGLAPYNIETELQLLITEHGDAIVAAEFKRDFLLTNRIAIEPMLEFAVESGSSEVAAELRARYEITRKFAPYIGVSWRKSHGDAADLLRLIGEDTSATSALVGIRFWF